MRTNFDMKTIDRQYDHHHINHHPDQLSQQPPHSHHRRRAESNRQLAYRHPPFFIVFVSIFELVTFVYYALRSDEQMTLTGPVPFASKLIYNPYRRYEVWRYVTYTFIHAGYWHIIFNLLIQLAVGIPLEIVHKFNPIFIIYFGGILGGSLGNSIADSHSYLAGASSGCYALITAHLANLIINWNELRGNCLKLISLLAFCSIDLGTAVYERHFKIDSIAYRTSYGGHLAGALSGLLLGLVFLRNVKIHQWEKFASRSAGVMFVFLIVSAIAFNILSSDYFPLSDRRDLVWSHSPYMRDRE